MRLDDWQQHEAAAGLLLRSEWKTIINEMASFYCCMTVTLDLLLSVGSTCGGTYGMVSMCRHMPSLWHPHITGTIPAVQAG